MITTLGNLSKHLHGLFKQFRLLRGIGRVISFIGVGGLLQDLMDRLKRRRRIGVIPYGGSETEKDSGGDQESQTQQARFVHGLKLLQLLAKRQFGLRFGFTF
jgi:hypothetical protein